MSRIGVKAPGMIAVMAPVRSGVKRRFERPQEGGFLLDFATAVSPFSGIGLGLRKLSPSMTMRYPAQQGIRFSGGGKLTSSVLTAPPATFRKSVRGAADQSFDGKANHI